MLDSGIAVSNNYASAIKILDVQAPEGLQGWTASLSQDSVEPGGQASGSWDAETIPADVLDELKSNGGQLTLKMKGTISSSSFRTSRYSGRRITSIVGIAKVRNMPITKSTETSTPAS